LAYTIRNSKMFSPFELKFEPVLYIKQDYGIPISFNFKLGKFRIGHPILQPYNRKIIREIIVKCSININTTNVNIMSPFHLFGSICPWINPLEHYKLFLHFKSKFSGPNNHGWSQYFYKNCQITFSYKIRHLSYRNFAVLEENKSFIVYLIFLLLASDLRSSNPWILLYYLYSSWKNKDIYVQSLQNINKCSVKKFLNQF
jgi:hypothetical protein